MTSSSSSSRSSTLLPVPLLEDIEVAAGTFHNPTCTKNREFVPLQGCETTV